MTQICCIAIANTGFKTGQPSFFLSPKQGNKEYIGQILVQYLPLPPPLPGPGDEAAPPPPGNNAKRVARCYSRFKLR